MNIRDNVHTTVLMSFDVSNAGLSSMVMTMECTAEPKPAEPCHDSCVLSTVKTVEDNRELRDTSYEQ